MVINVEMIGHALMIQRYVAETATPTLCKLVSVSEAFTPNGRTHVQVVRTLNVKKIDENACELVSSTTVHPTAEFMILLPSTRLSLRMPLGPGSMLRENTTDARLL